MERTNIRALDSWEKFQEAVTLASRQAQCKLPRSDSASSLLSSSPQRGSSHFDSGQTRMTEKVEPIDIFVMDLSFISLKSVLLVVKTIVENSCHSDRAKQVEEYLSNGEKGSLRFGRDDKSGVSIIALIKPQFEVGKKIADKYKGVIKDETIRKEVVEDIKRFAKSLGIEIKGVTDSPILGAKGNKEFLIYLSLKV